MLWLLRIYAASALKMNANFLLGRSRSIRGLYAPREDQRASNQTHDCDSRIERAIPRTRNSSGFNENILVTQSRDENEHKFRFKCQ